MSEYIPRLADALIDRLFQEVPAIVMAGPRAAGKTTTAIRRARSVVRLDAEAEAVAFRADPDAALRGMVEPVLLDEWQEVPGVLGAIKRSVDRDPHPGRFVVTGSAAAGAEAVVWPGTGRLVRVPLYGMTVREVTGAVPGVPLLDRIVAGSDLVPAAEPTDLRDYLDLALRSGFPEPALRLTERTRRHWLESYLEHLLARDVAAAGGRDPVRLRRYLEAYALNTAGVVDEQTLITAAGINRRTAQAYERLLTDLFVVESLPAWTSNRLKRLTLLPKRHVVDPGLAAAILGVDAGAVLRNGDLLCRLLETFVVAQIRAELAMSLVRPRLHHVRQQQGRIEADVLAEVVGGGLVGIEVKADSAPSADAARHLATLRDLHGPAFLAGIVLHTGPRTYRLGDRLLAVPISALWS